MCNLVADGSKCGRQRNPIKGKHVDSPSLHRTLVTGLSLLPWWLVKKQCPTAAPKNLWEDPQDFGHLYSFSIEDGLVECVAFS